jgi:hypothetical protein
MWEKRQRGGQRKAHARHSWRGITHRKRQEEENTGYARENQSEREW